MAGIDGHRFWRYKGEKSTSAYYMKAIVDDYMAATGGKESAVLSSIDIYDGVIRQESHITTPESVELHEHMRHAVDSGITYLEMEVSSQALKYDRVNNMQFDVAVYLNISEDHISPIEHKDFEDYISSKMKMFALAKQAVVNLDADFVERALKAAEDAGSFKTFSLKDPSADFYGYNIHKEDGEIIFSVKCDKFDETFSLTMPGLFNVENAVAVVAAATLLNIPLEYIKSGLHRARSSGRMELYTSADKRVTAVVDYAHNKLSFEKLFGSTREEYPDHDIVAIFGCPGYKAYIRRKDLGLIAGEYSKKVYLVAEDPGKEPVQQISEDIAQYVAQKNCPYEIIEDRGVAIHKAIMECKRPTVLLITGKGNETRQKYGTIYADCRTDVEYVKEAGNWYLRGYIDKPGGITVNDCETVSRAFSDRLDEDDFIEDSYIMEISSPGLDRPLKKEKDFARSIGKLVEIRTYRPIEKQKEFCGELTAYDNNSVTIDEEGTPRTFDKKDIALVRLAIDF